MVSDVNDQQIGAVEWSTDFQLPILLLMMRLVTVNMSSNWPLISPVA